MLVEPCFDIGVPVSAVIIHDQVQIRFAGKLAIDVPKKSQELLMTVPLMEVADNLACEQIEGGEKCRCSVPLIIVGHRSASSLLQRQAGLSAIWGLNLALLVDTEDDRLVRWIQV